MDRTTRLLYLHGFRSSPRSAKAQLTLAWLAEHRPDITAWCPQLPPSPREAIDLIETGMADWPRDEFAVIGSSLGGFYATVVAERLGCKAALLNPAVDPARDLAHHIGVQNAWHSDEQFFFKPRFVDELRAMTPTAISNPSRYFTVITKGDEVLDWREMTARYAHSPGLLLEGGDHAISDYALHLPAVMRQLLG